MSTVEALIDRSLWSTDVGHFEALVLGIVERKLLFTRPAREYTLEELQLLPREAG